MWGAASPPDGPFGQIIGRPVGIDDSYHTGIGETLSVKAFGVLANDNNAIGDPQVFYLDANKHIITQFWFSNWWSHFDVTASTQAPPVAGGVISSVSANGNPCVYYVTTDGHIHELAWYAGQLGHTWYHRDLTADTDGTQAVVNSALSSISVGGYPHVYYLDANQHIHQLAWTDNGWTHSDLTTLAGATPAVPGSPLSTTTTANGDPAIYYFTSDYSVYELARYNSQWLHWDLMSDSTWPPAVRGSTISAVRVKGDPRIYYKGTDFHIHEVAWLGGEWIHSDLNTRVPPAENPANVDGAFGAITIIDDLPRVYYLDVDRHVNELAWVGDSWHFTDLTDKTVSSGGTPTAFGSPISLTTAYLSPRVHYFTADGYVHELAWVVDKWSHGDITALTDGVTAGTNSPLSSTAASVDPLTAELAQGVDHGTLNLNSDGSFNYTPETGYEGIDQFTYKANDWWSLSDEVEVNITVGPPMVVVDVDISLYNNPTGDNRAPYENIIRHFADAVYESSNGARKLGTVTFYTASAENDDVNVSWVEKCHPCAWVAGYGHYGYIRMCDEFWYSKCDDQTCQQLLAADFMSDDFNQKIGGYTLAHEWGHYYFGLYDEYSLSPGDIPVPNSIMNQTKPAWNDGDLNWLNFSIAKNFNVNNSQFREYGASGWDTLARPASEDPMEAWTSGETWRHAYRDLQRVQPIGNEDSPIELPGTPRSELSFAWVTSPVAESSQIRLEESPLNVQLVSIQGVNISYPDPILLVAAVKKDLPLTGVRVQASVQLPNGDTMPVQFTDNGVPPDEEKDDGLYSTIVGYSMEGNYLIQVQFDNHAGTAAFVSSAFEPSAGPNGEYIPMPPPEPYTEDFTLSETLNVLVSNVAADDHGNTSATARSIAANNEPVAGKIDKVGDKDVFRFTTLDEGITYVRVTSLALGMSPKIRVLGSDGMTVLFEGRLEPNTSVYPFIPLIGVVPGSVVYTEVSDVSSISSGGLYKLSTGQKLASDVGVSRLEYTTQQFADGKAYTAVHLADMDGDGDPEILIGNRDTNSLEIWRYNENLETLAKLDAIEFPYHVHDIKAADFDRDGDVDVVVGLRTYGLYYAANTGSRGTFGSWSVHPIDETYSWQILVADIDKDSKLDILHGVDHGPINTFYGDGKGNFVPGKPVSDPLTEMRIPRGFNTIDLNGDGLLDLIGTDGSFMRAFLNPGDRASDWESVGPSSPIGTYPCCENHLLSEVYPSAGDVDGNGVVDLVALLGNPNTNGPLEILLFKGDKTGNELFWEEMVLDTLSSSGWAGHAGMADLDGDGNLDVHVGGWSHFNGMQLYFGNGNGGFISKPVVLDHGVGEFNSFAIGDVNGDNVMDIVTNRFTDNNSGASGFEVLYGSRVQTTPVIYLPVIRRFMFDN